MRIGRANPAILDSVVVPVDEGTFPLNQLAQVVVKDPQNLIVNVYDSETLSAVDKAIRIAGLNLNPVIDNKIIRVPIPKLNKEFRENLIKMAGKTSEKAKMSVRNVRQDALKQVKKEKSNGASEDDIKKLEKKVQAIVDKVSKEIEDIHKAKSNEIMKS
ncbi:putative ribosome recycling factor [Basidiobolus meristosporus CBS 931.73]|uniref:Putative ribosome recycling factor n=1 Tax=Basidiobolus meristosporus CBS 931.73 TaxID=1314790 RepID=A0A1Y1YML3_9FUNG|nr:putative ribosome recycling factor [Basidiobolus meristosporus CBS 931.73]|eukprot:ORX99260.1 putative ribosome recycling factor [Basidiobolus meristosporus CBS 931.73]